MQIPGPYPSSAVQELIRPRMDRFACDMRDRVRAMDENAERHEMERREIGRTMRRGTHLWVNPWARPHEAVLKDFIPVDCPAIRALECDDAVR